MNKIIEDILDELRSGAELDGKRLATIIHSHDKQLEPGKRHYSKKRLLPYYLKAKRSQPELWKNWGIDDELERKLVSLLQVKPRRTASGVATITVITKPWPCRGQCVFCPSDLRMPKSYLHDEPACQRAERTFFDPYLQVSARLRALSEMGHPVDKIELIVLGGSWSDYDEGYRIWFVSELFRALNDPQEASEALCRQRKRMYQEAKISNAPERLEAFVEQAQARIDAGLATYSDEFDALYGEGSAWAAASAWQTASLEELEAEQKINESASHRVVGLVMETRPDLITPSALTELRRMGCTKVQIGVQTLRDELLACNSRGTNRETIAKACGLLRLFGYKIHTHFMVNLSGSTPELDKEDFLEFVTDPRYLPDEIKLYPCVLVQSSQLATLFDEGRWVPYSSEELLDVLVTDTVNTPGYVRISRMIRDISATDIIAGNKRANLRQMVEQEISRRELEVQEIRTREISLKDVDLDSLSLETIEYETAVSDEFFCQWVAPDNSIAGFCRLSLPSPKAIVELGDEAPVGLGEAMIREVHVYGRVSRIHENDAGAQHLGLGKSLVERVCDIARSRGYESINVISSVGTREYYRKLGFEDNGLYQSRQL